MSWASSDTAVHSNLAQVITRSGSRAGDGHKRRSDAPAQSINWQYMMIFTLGVGATQQCLPFRVPPGCKVKARAYNGASAGNSGPVTVGLSRGETVYGKGTSLAPLDYVEFPVNNTARIWASGAQGDGVVISVFTDQ